MNGPAWIFLATTVVAIFLVAIAVMGRDEQETLARHWRTRYQLEHEKRLDAEYQTAELETVLVAYDTHFPLWTAEMEAGE